MKNPFTPLEVTYVALMVLYTAAAVGWVGFMVTQLLGKV